MNKTPDGTYKVPVIPIERIRTILPYFESVSAGFPSPADDYVEEKLSLDRYLIKNPASTFFLRVSGTSMTGAGIYPNDILIVDRSLEPKNKDVVIALIDGELTVKRFIKANNKFYLKPENPDFKPIEIPQDREFMIWGVITNVIHKPYEL
ncbi:translesion error-prone DNA polymerase V autoproteolytic subunit [Haliscomenobacter sp.]|uniref:LexA family protein n=1 Tax=Haliscomenobacter sp. TaxID=2717303 RepID=UPI003364C8ED